MKLWKKLNGTINLRKVVPSKAGVAQDGSAPSQTRPIVIPYHPTSSMTLTDVSWDWMDDVSRWHFIVNLSHFCSYWEIKLTKDKRVEKLSIATLERFELLPNSKLWLGEINLAPNWMLITRLIYGTYLFNHAIMTSWMTKIFYVWKFYWTV